MGGADLGFWVVVGIAAALVALMVAARLSASGERKRALGVIGLLLAGIAAAIGILSGAKRALEAILGVRTWGPEDFGNLPPLGWAVVLGALILIGLILAGLVRLVAPRSKTGEG